MRYMLAALLLLLLPATTSFADQYLDLSCANVHYVELSKHGEKWHLAIQLSPEESESFYNMTSRHVGEPVILRAGGEELFSVYDDKYDKCNGRVWHSMDTHREALAMAGVICTTKVRWRRKAHDDSIPDSIEFMVEHPERYPSPTFPVSCEIVERMELWRVPLRYCGGRYCYMLVVEFTEEGLQDFASFLETVGLQFFQAGGEVRPHQHIQLEVAGERIVTDAPLWDNAFADVGAALTFKTLERARDAANRICREKVPGEVITGGN